MTELILDNQKDLDLILSKRFDNGADFWATPENQLNIGGPFSTLESAVLLTELGMSPSDPVLESVAALIFDCLRDDGRFKLSPSGAIYPCHTIHALNVLCHLGYAEDERLKKRFSIYWTHNIMTVAGAAINSALVEDLRRRIQTQVQHLPH